MRCTARAAHRLHLLEQHAGLHELRDPTSSPPPRGPRGRTCSPPPPSAGRRPSRTVASLSSLRTSSATTRQRPSTAPRAHAGEELVAWRVEEGDRRRRARVDDENRDRLRDPARLRRCELRAAERVEHRRLAVVDVAHQRDHGSARRPRARRPTAAAAERVDGRHVERHAGLAGEQLHQLRRHQAARVRHRLAERLRLLGSDGAAASAPSPAARPSRARARAPASSASCATKRAHE